MYSQKHVVPTRSDVLKSCTGIDPGNGIPADPGFLECSDFRESVPVLVQEPTAHNEIFTNLPAPGNMHCTHVVVTKISKNTHTHTRIHMQT